MVYGMKVAGTKNCTHTLQVYVQKYSTEIHRSFQDIDFNGDKKALCECNYDGRTTFQNKGWSKPNQFRLPLTSQQLHCTRDHSNSNKDIEGKVSEFLFS